MPVVFDSHVHCFPPMADDDVHLPERVAELQHHVRFHGQGIRRARDHSVVNEPILVGEKDGISWQPDVGFRFGKFGRLEFTHGGEDLYMQWMPPTLWDMSSPAEYIIAQMDYAGVDRGFMQHDRLYGYLDEFFADCVSRYPDRLVAGAQVDEWRGGEPDQLDRLRRQVQELGASALYFSTGGFFHNDFSTGVNHESLRPLWDLVADLGIPIHWSPCAMLVPIAEDYIRELRELNEWADNYPQIASVLTHGLSNIFLEKGRPDRYRIPPETASLLERGRLVHGADAPSHGRRRRVSAVPAGPARGGARTGQQFWCREADVGLGHALLRAHRHLQTVEAAVRYPVRFPDD